MALTENQQKSLYLLFQINANPTYMQAINDSDEYALSELKRMCPIILDQFQDQQNNIALLQATIAELS